DFGVAAARGRITSTRTGQVKGKLSYIAPEKLDRPHMVDARADIWSLGVLAWELFAGRRLFRVDGHPETLWNILNKRVHDLQAIDEGVDADVAELVHRCLRRPIHERPRSAAEVGAAFERAARAHGIQSERDVRAFMHTRFAEIQVVEEQRLASA